MRLAYHPEEAKLLAMTTLGAARLRGLPALEAVPPELVRGADLIGEPVGVDPALFLRAPATIPGELDQPRFSAAFNRDCSNEIGAAGTRIDLKSIDHPFWVRVEELIDESDHLDARHSPHECDRWRLAAIRKGENVGLESIGRARTAENGGVEGHAGNISGCCQISAPIVCTTETKLTAQSALASSR